LIIKSVKPESINCLFGETVDTYVSELLVTMFAEEQIKLLELSGIKAWLVDTMEVTEDGLKFHLSLF